MEKSGINEAPCGELRATNEDALESKNLITGSYRRDGEYIGRFRVVEEIAQGKGGMGRVFKAHDEALDRFVVVKLMRARLNDYGTAEQLAQRFRNESVIAANIAHPNIITIYERGEHQGHEYFAMEYMDRGSLDDLVQAAWDTSEASIDAGGPPVFIPLETLHDYFLQATAGLRALHEKGYIHRDIKLANFLLANRLGGGVLLKLADFGVVRKPDSDLTYDGSMLGTARYMAPEYFEVTADGHPLSLDHRSDLYALGLALYECLTLWYPFHNVKDVRDANATHRRKVCPVLPSRLRPGLPVGWDYVTMTLLERDRERRYQSASAVYDDLLNIEQLAPYLGDGAASDEEIEKWLAEAGGDPAKPKSSSPNSPRATSASMSASAKSFASSSFAVNSSSVVAGTSPRPVRQRRRVTATLVGLVLLVVVGCILWFGRPRTDARIPSASRENEPVSLEKNDSNLPNESKPLEPAVNEQPVVQPIQTKIEKASAIHRPSTPEAAPATQKKTEPTVPTRRLGSRFYMNPREVEEKKRAATRGAAQHENGRSDSPPSTTPTQPNP